MKPVILITGINGQVGHSLFSVMQDYGNIIPVGRSHKDIKNFQLIDLYDKDSVVSLVRKIHPDIIINAAAYTAVDRAEQEEELAFKINAEIPEILATEALKISARLFHFSTDYVFDGSGEHFHSEDETTSPLNAYGRTKLAGENAIIAIGGKYLILRTSWVISEYGNNFIKTMLRLGTSLKHINVVSDQIGSPTSSNFLASTIYKIIQNAKYNDISGIFNATNSGITNWYEFALKIFTQAKEMGFNIILDNVEKILTKDYITPAKRPLNSRLNCDKLSNTFNIKTDSWVIELNKIMLSLTNNK